RKLPISCASRCVWRPDTQRGAGDPQADSRSTLIAPIAAADVAFGPERYWRSTLRACTVILCFRERSTRPHNSVIHAAPLSTGNPRVPASNANTPRSPTGKRRRAVADIQRDSAADLRARIERLETAVEARDAFIAMVAHELRNPMTPIRGQVEVLQTLAR